jgi:hypothetical protein
LEQNTQFCSITVSLWRTNRVAVKLNYQCASEVTLLAMHAIVLEGGGGKGAYQMGALLALRYSGERYDLITGSSVGALNGMLLATDQLGKGFRLWWNIQPSSVLAFYRLSLLTILLLPAYALMLLRSAPRSEDPKEARIAVLYTSAFLFVFALLLPLQSSCSKGINLESNNGFGSLSACSSPALSSLSLTCSSSSGCRRLYRRPLRNL